MHRSSVIEEQRRDGSTPPRRIDVSDLDARTVQEFVRSSVTTEAVSFEHRGSKTYLVVGE